MAIIVTYQNLIHKIIGAFASMVSHRVEVRRSTANLRALGKVAEFAEIGDNGGLAYLAELAYWISK